MPWRTTCGSRRRICDGVKSNCRRRVDARWSWYRHIRLRRRAYRSIPSRPVTGRQPGGGFDLPLSGSDGFSPPGLQLRAAIPTRLMVPEQIYARMRNRSRL